MEVISSNDYNSFLGSLNTITSEMEGDLSDLFSNKISKAEFLKKYGHLRPGTYYILSLRYDENFENYFSKTNKNKKRKVFFSLTKEHKTKIEALISKSGLEISYSELIKFIKESIEAREYAKFIFTSTLSDIINLAQLYPIIGAAAGSLFVFKGKYRAVLINYPSHMDRNRLF